MKLLEKLNNLSIAKILILVGSILLSLSFFANLSFGKDGIEFIRRINNIKPLYYISIALIIIGIFQSFYFKSKKESKTKDKKKDSKLLSKKDKIISNFDELRTTQKVVVKEIYRYHKDEISCDDLFEIMKTKHSNSVKSHSEMFYRLMEIESRGLIGSVLAGNKTTVVKIPQHIEETLEQNRRLIS